jgi:AraC-like DNA-binding protein
MLSAQGQLELAGSSMRSSVFLERRLRMHVLHRKRLLFDSTFVPPARGASGSAHLFVQMSGTFVIAGAGSYAAPCAFVLAETELDHMQRGALTYRSFGERSTVIEVRVPAADLRRPVGLVHGPIELADSVWAAYHALDAEPTEPAVYELITRLGDTDVLSRDLTASVVAREPERFARLWAALRPQYEQDLATSASLKLLAARAGLSSRQIGRDVRDLTHTFGLFGAGFRYALRVNRLLVAVLLLSAPDGTPSQVALAVGYGSLDAMGRAFRDAHLPAPSVVQAVVRYREP